MSRPAAWQIRGGSVSLSRPVVVGILNVTPDSFSDGGEYRSPEAALAHAQLMLDAGADVIDVGGESTRPGAPPVSAAEEWKRVSAVIAPLARMGAVVSIDTTKREVAERALEDGAAIVNDVSGLEVSPDMAELCAREGAGLVIMHMRGDPATMQDDTVYDDLLGEVAGWLGRRADVARRAGCEAAQIVVDPGLGFGKSAEGSLALLAGTSAVASLGYPVLVGPSRKSFIGKILNVPVEQRLEGTIAACLAALQQGARLFRVHDVAPVRRALDMADAIRRAG